MKYTQIPSTAFQEIQLNAGILVDDFDPATGTIGKLLGATTGGVNFTDTPTYTDFGEDIDNCPKNMMELKKLESHEVKMSGTFVTLSADTAKMLVAVGDVDAEDNTHIIPRNDLLMTDFITVWWIGDYSDDNNGDNAGFVAIKMINALNTGGFQIQSSDKAKGQFAFEFTGHYSMNAQDKVPYEVYIKAGGVASVSVSADADDATYLWTDLHPSDFQSNVKVANGAITGTLAYIEDGLSPSGPLAGSGNFLALKFSAADWSKFTSVKVALDPSSSGMSPVEIIDDPDKNGVFKISNNNQVFKVIASDGVDTVTTTYSLKGLVLETE